MPIRLVDNLETERGCAIGQPQKHSDCCGWAAPQPRSDLVLSTNRIGMVWTFIGPPFLKQQRLFVWCLPEGDLRIAHPFKGGTVEKGSLVPKGRLNHSHKNGTKSRSKKSEGFDRPFGTVTTANLDPAVNCRAILESPFGRSEASA